MTELHKCSRASERKKKCLWSFTCKGKNTSLYIALPWISKPLKKGLISLFISPGVGELVKNTAILLLVPKEEARIKSRRKVPFGEQIPFACSYLALPALSAGP